MDIKKLHNELKCGICLELMKLPLTLKCSHKFCCECLQKLIDNLKTDDSDELKENEIICPQCRLHSVILVANETREARNYFPLDCTLNNIINIITLSSESEQLIKEEQLIYNNNLNLTNLQFNKPKNCSYHPLSILRHFCVTCEESLCLACVAINHSGHNVESEKNAKELAKKFTLNYLDKIYKVTEQISAAVVEIDVMNNKISDSNCEVMREIELKFEESIETLENRKKQLINELYEVCNTKIKRLKLQKFVLLSEKEKLLRIKKTSIKKINDCNLTENLSLCDNLKKLLKDSEELMKKPEEDDSLLYISPLDSDMLITKSLGRLKVEKTCASLCVASGEGLRHAKVASEAIFFVSTKNRKGIVRVELVDIKILIQDISGKYLTSDVEIYEEGKIMVKYKPLILGVHEVSIFLHEVEINGSPFTVQVHSIRNIVEINKPKLCFGQYGSDHKEFKSPLGITCDLNERIYVVDSFNRRIQVFNSSGQDICILGQFNQPTSSSNHLQQPWGIVYCIDQDKLAISDHAKNQLKIFSHLMPETIVDNDICFMNCELTIGSPDSIQYNFQRPCGISYSKFSKLLLLCDSGNNRLQAYDMEGQFQFSLYGKNEKYSLNTPRYAAFDCSSNLIYLSDTKNNRILAYDHRASTYQFQKTIDTCIQSKEKLFQQPKGIYVDENDNIFVADSGNNCIRIMHGDGIHIKTISGNGDKKNIFCPEDLTITRYGSIITTDSKNHNITIF